MERVLVTGLLMVRQQQRFETELRQAGLEPVFEHSGQFLTEAELLPIIGDFDGVIAGDDELTERVLRAGLPRLKVISKWGVGLDSIDCAAAEKLGIPVYNTPGAFGEAVAEAAIGYLLMLTRHLHLVDQAVRRGEWPKPVGQSLADKTLGLVGFGAIGRALASRAQVFGMEILAADVRADVMDPVPGVRFAAFEELLTEADYLCLACNLTAENRGLLGVAELARMRPTAYVLNMARGPLIDQEALVAALAEGRLAGAALDVYEEEPLPQDHPLARMEQVVLGSHNANNLAEANERVHRNTIRNLLRGLGLPT
ncbi:MAG: phosphoglycerate dehydrogenase [Acidobacteriota bacterium]